MVVGRHILVGYDRRCVMHIPATYPNSVTKDDVVERA